MKWLLCTALLLAAAIAPASAERDVIETVVVRSADAGEPIRPDMQFGYSASYTDSMDCLTRGECEIPAVPPSFWVMFIDQKQGFGLNKDIRGIPDSVASGTVNKFSMKWEIDISRDKSPDAIISFPDALTPGIDSIVVVDKVTGGSAFHHTFTTGNSQVLIPFGSGIRLVVMTVYYDRRTAAAPMPILARREATSLFYPNPVHGGASLALRSPLPADGRYQILDLLGREVRSTLQAPEVPGFYLARVLDSDGQPVATERLLVVP